MSREVCCFTPRQHALFHMILYSRRMTRESGVRAPLPFLFLSPFSTPFCGHDWEQAQV